MTTPEGSSPPVRSRATSIRVAFGHLTRSSEGQDLVEYGVVIGIIAAVLVVSLSGIGGRVANMYTSLTAAIGAGDPGGGNPGGGNPGGGNPGGGNPGGGNPGGGNPGGGNPGGGNPGGGNPGGPRN